MQFTKLRSGPTRPLLQALLKPTTPTPMPAPTSNIGVRDRFEFHGNCQMVRGPGGAVEGWRGRVLIPLKPARVAGAKDAVNTGVNRVP
jgi:hypothetical protein